MLLPYTAGVVLVSLALYGLWQVLKDVWGCLTSLRGASVPPASLVVIVHNMENDVEHLMRFLISQADLVNDYAEEGALDIVIVDAGSTDLTLPILLRLSEQARFFSVISIAKVSKQVLPILEILPLCRGAVVHIFDLTGRLNKNEFKTALRSLVQAIRRKDQYEPFES